MADQAGGAGFIRWTAEGEVAVLTLARPEKANAYHPAMLSELSGALDALSGSAAPRALIVAADGRSFCAGADLGEIARRTPLDALDLTSQRIFDRLARSPFVTIAAVQGPAIAGGFELALACDLRLASPQARFALPETSLGIVPAAGGTQRLPRLVGVSRAKQIILAGREVSAEEALAWGLVMEIVSGGALLDRARELARAIAARDALATRLAKEAMDLTTRGDAGLALETLAQALLTSRAPR